MNKKHFNELPVGALFIHKNVIYEKTEYVLAKEIVSGYFRRFNEDDVVLAASNKNIHTYGILDPVSNDLMGWVSSDTKGNVTSDNLTLVKLING